MITRFRDLKKTFMQSSVKQPVFESLHDMEVFYNDRELKEFYLETVSRKARSGRVISARMPRRSLDHCTIAYAFLSGGSIAKASLATGIPVSFLLAADMIGITTEDDVFMLFSFLVAGENLVGFASNFIYRIVSDADFLNEKIIDCACALTLRSQWVDVYNSNPEACGGDNAWTVLRLEIRDAISGSLYTNEISRHLLLLLSKLCPPPQDSDMVWQNIFASYLKYLFIARHAIMSGHTHHMLQIEHDLALHMRSLVATRGDCLSKEENQLAVEEWFDTKPEARTSLQELRDTLSRGSSCIRNNILRYLHSQR